MESSCDVTLGLGRPPWPGSPISSRWRASYSIPGSDSRLEGGLILRHAERRLVLLDREGIAVDVRQADPSNPIVAGTSVKFPYYLAVVGEIWASPTAPPRLGRSPVRPRRALGPRALFPLDQVLAREDSRPDHVGLERDSGNLPSMAATCAPLTCPDQSSVDPAITRVSPPQLTPFVQISRFQHIWDRGRAAGAPRVVFIDREIRSSILRPAQPSSWWGTVSGDSRSFAAVTRSAPMSNFGRGGRGGPQYPNRPNYAPRRPPGGFAAGAFDGGASRNQIQRGAD
jgi:hypothetical protein